MSKKPVLTDMDGVGPKLEEKLVAAGFKTVAKVSKSDPAKLANKVDGLSESKAANIISSAKKIMPKAPKAKKAEPKKDTSKKAPAKKKVETKAKVKKTPTKKVKKKEKPKTFRQLGREYADLKGKRVNIGNPGSGTRGTWEVLEAALGWERSDLALRNAGLLLERERLERPLLGKTRALDAPGQRGLLAVVPLCAKQAEQKLFVGDVLLGRRTDLLADDLGDLGQTQVAQ